MDRKQLMHFVELPDTHRRLLSDYDGVYALGIGQDGGDSVLVLEVEPDAAQVFPKVIRLDGEAVRVLVERNFVVPTPLSTEG